MKIFMATKEVRNISMVTKEGKNISMVTNTKTRQLLGTKFTN